MLVIYLTFSDDLRRTIECEGTYAYCIMYTSLGSASIVIANSAQGKSLWFVWGGTFDEVVHKAVKQSTAQIW